MKIEILSRWNDDNVLFSYTSEGNTIGKTLAEAIDEGANLEGANLVGANLVGADLRRAKGIENVFLPMYSKWSFSIQDNLLKIGCKTKTFEEWNKWFFDTDEEYETPRETENFKRIIANFLAVKAYHGFLKSSDK